MREGQIEKPIIEGSPRRKAGRPHGSLTKRPIGKEVAYLKATTACCSLQDWRDIVRRAVIDAKNGNHAARYWLSNVLLGSPEAIRATLQQADAMQVVVDNLAFSFYTADDGTHGLPESVLNPDDPPNK